MQMSSPNRSPTAAPGWADARADFVYSSIIVAHGGQGQQTMFSVGKGSAIPSLKGSAITLAAPHHLTHDYHSTNITEAGRLGSAIGDVMVSSIALNIEQATPLLTAGSVGTFSTFGATAQEMADISSKCYFILKVGGKEMTKGPIVGFPANGAVVGSFASTANDANFQLASNGPAVRPGRKLPQFIQIDRTDPVEGIVGVAGGASLAFRTTSAAGAETMITCVLDCGVRGDVR